MDGRLWLAGALNRVLPLSLAAAPLKKVGCSGYEPECPLALTSALYALYLHLPRLPPANGRRVHFRAADPALRGRGSARAGRTLSSRLGAGGR